ncbi:MAG: hypothetical protein F4203_04450 [Rhodobacteraceae bacterium]|nr:hypothetical protein [Paracoccaceae bacterium]
MAISKGKTITHTSGNNLSSRCINILGRTHKICDILDQLPIRPIDPKRNIIKRQLGTIITILDQSLRIRHEKAQSVNRVDNVPAITETRYLPDWLVSVGWTGLSLLADELANITFEGLKGKGREFMGGASALLMLRYPFPIASVVDFPEVGNSNHVFGPTKRKPLKAIRQPIHRDNLEKYTDGLRSVSENTIISMIRIKGLPLARGLIQNGKDILGETDGVFEDALSEINSRENQNTGNVGKVMAGCMVVIALLWDLFQWLPSQQDKPEYSQSSFFVARGSSLEIILPFYDLTYNLLTGKNSPKSLAGLR